MWIFVFFIVFLLPSPVFSSILLPQSSDLAAGLYMPLIVYWNLFIIGIVGFSSLLKKTIQLRTAMVIAIFPHVIYGIFFIVPAIGSILSSPDQLPMTLEYTLPVLLIAGIQIILLAFLLKYLFYRPDISKEKKIVIFLVTSAVVAYFIPKELFAIRDQGLYFANEKPLKCTCIGMPAGEPGDLGYYCFGMPITCQETENKREPIRIIVPTPTE